MKTKNYGIPENLVVRICGCFPDTELTEAEYLYPDAETARPETMLGGLDKECSWKSMVLGVTQQGLAEGMCCPMHTNPGLLPVMKTVRGEFPKVGKGNIGFGSAICAADPGAVSAPEKIADMQKQAGVYVNLARRYENSAYTKALAEHHIIPLPICAESEQAELPFETDDYLLLKDIKQSLGNGTGPRAYVVRQGEPLKQVSLKFALNAEEKKKILEND